MESKDVKQILDIPNIDFWLNKIFTLSCYEGGDKILFYSCEIGSTVCDVNISVDICPNLIEGQKKLSDLIMFDNIGMFEMKTGIQTKEWDGELGFWNGEWVDIHQSHWYRPFLKESEKQY